MKISFNEQDLIDAVGRWGADRDRRDPMDAQVELRFQGSTGITAEVTWKDRTKGPLHLTEEDIIDSTADYLSRQHLFPPDRLTIEVMYDPEEGFAAEIIVL
ncbi:DUF2653 family protein [Paenibacillus sp. GD4]|jgi:hypothetical protein|uniref:DUF2653 family protein n=1 Tax=Paenibacillus sp. GD4 TaxID=3068890 RepID=UPI002796B21F|nr:DUF2653 family protein [Paenibacillus sp. GD4]MDQ1909892.1 DUF2653 family protein [Paenibacillus sp. GD4]